MKLHTYPEEFKNLITIVAEYKHLPETAIERDYYIVLLLKNLADSEYADKCVFKGGTSLSKCYPGSIERFSEDIDLTFLGMDESNKVCDKTIKKIEQVMTVGANTEKIISERSDRSKSMLVWFGDKSNRVKLEIGSNIRTDPYSKKTLKSYIHEFLDNKDELKRLIRITKDTDKYYLLKRNTNQDYAPTGKYDFPSWKNCLTEQVRSIYENLNKDLLYTDEKQNFDEALETFEKIDALLKSINE